MVMKEIPCFESPAHSTLIFVLNRNKMYASEIAKKVREQQGTIQRRLMKLKKEGFVNLEEHPKKLKNIKLFSVNWNNVFNEFFRLLKEHKKEFLEIHKRLKTNIQPDKLENLKLLDSKQYLEAMKKNKYLNTALSEYFSSISKIKVCSLSQALFYFVFFGNFEFIYSSHPSIYGFLSWKDTIKHLEKKDKKWEKFPKSKEEFKQFKEMHNRLMADMRKTQEEYDNKIKKLINRDKDLRNMLFFDKIIKLLGSDLGLQIALNDAIELTAFSIIQSNFKKEEVEKYKDNLFFKHSKRSCGGISPPLFVGHKTS